jgi:acylphosphatase
MQPEPGMAEARRWHVSGRVQGVWFRESTRHEAERLGLTGYAKNLPDGRVEVLGCGDPGALDQLEAWLHQGPPMAEVGNVCAEPADEASPDAFTTH